MSNDPLASDSSSNDPNSQLSIGNKVKLQSLDDFLRNNQAQALPPQTIQLQTKKQKANIAPDQDVVAAEKIALTEIGVGINWVGRLQEYRAANAIRPQTTDIPHYGACVNSSLTEVIYTDQTIIHNSVPRFLMAVLIAEHPGPIGSSIPFSTKKSAKQYAAKTAVDWLIANKYMPSDGSLKFPRAAPTEASVSASSVGPVTRIGGNGQAPKIASQIPDLCNRLGFRPPKYVLDKVAGTDNLWDVYASFEGDPRLEPRVGLVIGVHGKVSAKERCAEGVWGRLKALERKRLGETEDLEEDVFYDA